MGPPHQVVGSQAVPPRQDRVPQIRCGGSRPPSPILQAEQTDGAGGQESHALLRRRQTQVGLTSSEPLGQAVDPAVG